MATLVQMVPEMFSSVAQGIVGHVFAKRSFSGLKGMLNGCVTDASTSAAFGSAFPIRRLGRKRREWQGQCLNCKHQKACPASPDRPVLVLFQ